MTPTSGKRIHWIIAVVMIALFALPWAAFADDVSNDLDTTVDAVAEVMSLNVGGANGTTNLYIVPRNGDGKNGCNLIGSTTLIVNVVTSNPSVATVSPSSITFESCGDTPTLTVTPHDQGSTTISVNQVSNTTEGTFNLAPATFTVNVAPPPNTPPSVSVLGVTGGASYNKGSVPAATCQVTDAEDGPSSFPATLSAITGPYASDGIGEQTASCSYTDAGGLTAEASVTYGIVDPTAPSIIPQVGGTLGQNGWYVSDVTVTWSIVDNESSISSTTGCDTVTITSDQEATTYTCSATSAGGTSAESVTIKRDATAPTITASLSGSPASTGWYNIATDAPTVSFSCSDATSGLASACPGDYTFGEGANQGYSQTIYDKAGNSASAGVSGIDVDLTAPTATASASPEPNANGWNNTDVTVSFSGNDSGSGVASCTAPVVLSAEDANQSASGTCTDLAGNVSQEAEVTGINIDKTAPTISGSASPAANGAGWNNTDVTVSFSCSDNLSGVASCGPDTTLSSEGAGQSATGTVTDNAGNSASVTVSGINIDKTAPTLNPSVSPNPVLLNGSATATAGATDALSGVASASCGPVDTSSVGTHSITCSATDNAGNTASADASYVVTYKLCVLYDQTKSHKKGSTVPIKLQLCDVNGNNYSSPATAVAATGLAKLDSSASGILDDSGNANPDSNFRYSSDLQGYIYNLSTKPLSTGTWKLSFQVAGDSQSAYYVQFDVK